MLISTLYACVSNLFLILKLILNLCSPGWAWSKNWQILSKSPNRRTSMSKVPELRGLMPISIWRSSIKWFVGENYLNQYYCKMWIYADGLWSNCRSLATNHKHQCSRVRSGFVVDVSHFEERCFRRNITNVLKWILMYVNNFETLSGYKVTERFWREKEGRAQKSCWSVESSSSSACTIYTWKARMAQLVRALDSETCDSWAEHGSNPATVKGLS